MKIIVLLLFLITTSLIGFSQNDSTRVVPKNEFKINGLLTGLKFPEVSLERNFKHVSFGASLGANLAKPTSEGIVYPYGFMLTPFFRYFFFGKSATGLFIELNTSLFSAHITDIENHFGTAVETHTQEIRFGSGFSIGGKHIFGEKTVFEYYTGFGRDISGRSTDFYPRLGVAVGWRFQ